MAFGCGLRMRSNGHGAHVPHACHTATSPRQGGPTQPKVARATALEVKNTLQGQQTMFDAISDRFLAWNVTLSKPKRDFVLICVDGF